MEYRQTLLTQAVVRRSASDDGIIHKKKKAMHGHGLGSFVSVQIEATPSMQRHVQNDAGGNGDQQEVIVCAHPVITVRWRAQAVIAVVAHDHRSGRRSDDPVPSAMPAVVAGAATVIAVSGDGDRRRSSGGVDHGGHRGGSPSVHGLVTFAGGDDRR